LKITIIGAGSHEFTVKIVGDLVKTKELSGSVISLMDIDERGLNAAYNLSQRYVTELGGSLKFEKTRDMAKSLDGADFVINTVRARGKGHEDIFTQLEMINDIGQKHGYYRGLSSQEFDMESDYYPLLDYNQLKLSLDIAKAVEKNCPNAWLIEIANPVFGITQLVLRQTKAKIVGFCTGVLSTYGVYEVFKTLGLDPKDVDWQIAGVNHGVWLTRFLYKGKDAYLLLDKWIEEKSTKWEPKDVWDFQMSPAAIDMYRFYGKMPIGDTVRNGTWKYNYDLETKKRWFGKFGGVDNEIERPKHHREMRAIREKLISLANEPSIKLTKSWPDKFTSQGLSGDQHIPFINALVSGKKTRLFLNILNKGIISGIPDDVVVEVPVTVDKNGIHPENIEPDIPKRIKQMYLIPKILRMEWALEAFITGDRKVVEEIIVRDTRTKSFDQVKAVLNEIMALPFSEETRKHYK
jgi:alpha-galactosidase/6-phospho-beta-glucosidase family protein